MLKGISPLVFSCWLLERSINDWTVIFSHIYSLWFLKKYFWTSLISYLASGMLLFHENIQKYLFLCENEREKQNEQQCCSISFPVRRVLQVPAGRGSLGTAFVPCSQGTSAPFEAEIYCWMSGLRSRHSAWRVTYPKILFSAWGIVEGTRLFSQAWTLWPQSQAQGDLLLSYLVLRLWKVCQTKEVIIFICESCLETLLFISALHPSRQS